MYTTIVKADECGVFLLTRKIMYGIILRELYNFVGCVYHAVKGKKDCYTNTFSVRRTVKLLEERIIKDGIVLPGNILKVGSFLNHMLDVQLLIAMGEEVKRLYAGSQITKIVTVESSGIAIATAFGAVMNLPVVFAKKYKTLNVSGDVYTAPVHSYTHNKDYTMTVEKQYIQCTDKLLLVDDFLANGEALRGLLKIAKEAGASVTGAAIAIEKGFQHGGDALRNEGVRIESLAVIESMEDGKVYFRNA